MPETTDLQPQATPSKKVNWKKISFTLVFIMVAVGIIIALYGFLILNKPESAVPITTRKATPSAKISTPSSKKDETEGWETYDGETDSIKFRLKYPKDFTVVPKGVESPTPMITNKSSVIGNYENGDILVVIVVYKEVTRRKVLYQDSSFAGLKSEKGVGEDENLGVGVVSYIIQGISDKNDFSFECTFYPPKDTSLLKTCETIAATFKFID